MKLQRIFVLAVFVVIAAVGQLACGGAQNTEESSDEVIGEPPSETADPFRIMNTPEEASPASATGYIAPEESDEEADEESQVAMKASEAEPSEREKEAHEPEEAGEVQCFSCVRICPVDAGSSSADCSGKKRDVICGWGVHAERSAAERLARAECDGALDMARQTKTWKRIEGRCPPASCKER